MHYALSHLIGGKAKFLIEHLVGSRCSEVVKAEDGPCGYHTAQGAGQAGCQAECGNTGRDDGIPVNGILVEEQTDRRN